MPEQYLTPWPAPAAPAHGGTHDIKGSDPTYDAYAGDQSASRIDSIDFDKCQTAITPVTGTGIIACLTANQDMTVTNILFASGGTGISASTYLGLGLFTIDAADLMTHIADTGDVHASTFTTVNTIYTVALTASVAVTRGQRLGVYYLATGTVAGNLRAVIGPAGFSVLKPVRSRSHATQTAIPTGTVTLAAAPANLNRVWFALRGDGTIA